MTVAQQQLHDAFETLKATEEILENFQRASACLLSGNLLGEVDDLTV